MEIGTREMPAECISIYHGELAENTEALGPDYAYKIINIVALGILKLKDDLKIDFTAFEKLVEVRRLNRFPCVMFKIDTTSIILFRNGKIILTGLKRIEQIEELRPQIVDVLHQGNIEFSDFEIKIQNLVGMSQLGRKINLELACLTLTNCLYEPEQFPAAIVKPTSGGTFLIFSNSKIIGLGMRDTEMLENSLQELIQDIFDFDLFINVSDEVFEW